MALLWRLNHTGPQNYQAAELLAEKAEAHLNDGDNESAAVWASLAHTHAILASAAATTLGVLETWAWREAAGSKLSDSERGAPLPTQNPMKHRAARPPPAGQVVRARPVGREQTLADLAQRGR